MREIKFRVWSENLKKYVNDDGNGTYVLFENGYLSFVNLYTRELDERNIKEEKNIIEQFTGLKDKNGVEIYEGDIFKDYMDRHVEVYWAELPMQWKCRDISNNSFNHAPLREYKEPLDDFEIIGNIHEGVKE